LHENVRISHLICCHIRPCVFLCVCVCVHAFIPLQSILLEKSHSRKKRVLLKYRQIFCLHKAQFHYCNQKNHSFDRTLATLINSYRTFFNPHFSFILRFPRRIYNWSLSIKFFRIKFLYEYFIPSLARRISLFNFLSFSYFIAVILGGNWGDLGVDGWIILERISRRWNVGI